MKRAIIVLTVLAALPVRADELTLAPGRVEMGVFQPLRWGVSEVIEIDTAPLLMFVVPNVGVKIRWSESLATEHAIRYPTPLLKLLSKEGIGGVYPSDAAVPHIVTIETLARYRVELGKAHTATFTGGAIVSGLSGESTIVSVDLPLVFPRTASWHNGVTGRFGLDFDGTIAGPITYNADVDLFLMNDADALVHAESSVLLGWQIAWWVALQAGCKVVVGQYPFGSQVHFLPMADLYFTLRRPER